MITNSKLYIERDFISKKNILKLTSKWNSINSDMDSIVVATPNTLVCDFF